MGIGLTGYHNESYYISRKLDNLLSHSFFSYQNFKKDGYEELYRELSKRFHSYRYERRLDRRHYYMGGYSDSDSNRTESDNFIELENSTGYRILKLFANSFNKQNLIIKKGKAFLKTKLIWNKYVSEDIEVPINGSFEEVPKTYTTQFQNKEVIFVLTGVREKYYKIKDVKNNGIQLQNISTRGSKTKNKS